VVERVGHGLSSSAKSITRHPFTKLASCSYWMCGSFHYGGMQLLGSAFHRANALSFYALHRRPRRSVVDLADASLRSVCVVGCPTTLRESSHAAKSVAVMTVRRPTLMARRFPIVLLHKLWFALTMWRTRVGYAISHGALHVGDLAGGPDGRWICSHLSRAPARSVDGRGQARCKLRASQSNAVSRAPYILQSALNSRCAHIDFPCF